MSILDRAIDGVVRIGQGLATRMLNMSPPTANTARAKTLSALDALYWGRQYEQQGLATPWDKLRGGERPAPLRQQRPSVQYDLARVIVDRPTALLFGEGKFPSITLQPAANVADGADDSVAEVNEWIAAVADEGGLQSTALTWSRQGGSLGSAVITWCIAEGEFEFEAHKAKDCIPTFHPRKRSKLIKLEKRYVFRKSIESVDPISNVLTVREVDYWHRELWTETQHIVFRDEPVGDGAEPTWVEADNGTATHNFGFVPAYWNKNIDDGDPSTIDGVSLIQGLADIFEDVDRTLSQKSRAVRYNQDPERIYYGIDDKVRAQIELLRVGGGASTSLGKKTDGAGAELLELSGEGQTVAEAHVVAQRGRALETSRVTVPDPERLLAASKSGAALRILFAPTLELVGELRQSYGRALRAIIDQIVRAARSGALTRLGMLETPPPALIPAGKVKLQWGSFFDATPEDLSAFATAASTLKSAELFDRETLVRWLSTHFGVKDVAAVLDRIESDRNGEYGPLPGVNTKPGAKPPIPNGAGAHDPPEDNTDE